MNNTKMFSRGGLLLVAIGALAIIAVGNALFGGVRLDLTQNKLYTLSDGTKNILKGLEEPVNLYFFYSREAASDIPQLATYAGRVREMLREMEDVAGGQLKLTEINPEPFSEEEDRAAQFGLQGAPLEGGDSLYFGLAATNAIDETQVIPFFQLGQEAMLEYDLSKLVYQLSQNFKPVIGLLTGIDMGGGPDPQTFQPTQEWLVLDQLRQFFELKTINATDTELPADIEALMLVHPTGLSDELVYSIDQFLLGGGNALVFIDPYAETNTRGAGGMTEDPKAVSSNFETILGPLGLTMDEQQIVGDNANALVVGGAGGQQIYHLGLIGLAGEADDVVVDGLEQVNLGFAGTLGIDPEATTELTPLLQTSAESGLIPAFRVQPGQNPNLLRQGFTTTGTRYTVAARVRGEAKSAFPDGPPAGVENAEHKAESDGPVNLIVVADTDLLRDGLWVQVQNFLGQTMATPFASNGDFVINANDNMLGSADLIGIRARASYARPFEVVERLKREADAAYLGKERELQQRLQETERKISELQSQNEGGQGLILTPEQEAEIEAFRDDKLRIRKQLRDVRHSLSEDIDALGTRLKLINIGLVPLLLSIGVLGMALLRRRGGAR